MTKDALDRGITLEYAAAGATAAGAIAALVAGGIAGSIALIAFGLDSVIAGVDAGMLTQRLRRRRAEPDAGTERIPPGKTRFIVGVSFFLLALYLLNESTSRLFYGEKPEISMAGIVIAALSLIVMVMLTLMKLRLAATPGIRAFREYARENAVRGFLSAVLLAGLGLHAVYGWWWADPAAVLLMIPAIVREGWTAIEASKEAARAETSETRPPD